MSQSSRDMGLSFMEMSSLPFTPPITMTEEQYRKLIAVYQYIASNPDDIIPQYVDREKLSDSLFGDFFGYNRESEEMELALRFLNIAETFGNFYSGIDSSTAQPIYFYSYDSNYVRRLEQSNPIMVHISKILNEKLDQGNEWLISREFAIHSVAGQYLYLTSVRPPIQPDSKAVERYLQSIQPAPVVAENITYLERQRNHSCWVVSAPPFDRFPEENPDMEGVFHFVQSLGDGACFWRSVALTILTRLTNYDFSDVESLRITRSQLDDTMWIGNYAPPEGSNNALRMINSYVVNTLVLWLKFYAYILLATDIPFDDVSFVTGISDRILRNLGSTTGAPVLVNHSIFEPNRMFSDASIERASHQQTNTRMQSLQHYGFSPIGQRSPIPVYSLNVVIRGLLYLWMNFFYPSMGQVSFPSLETGNLFFRTPGESLDRKTLASRTHTLFSILGRVPLSSNIVPPTPEPPLKLIQGQYVSDFIVLEGDYDAGFGAQDYLSQFGALEISGQPNASTPQWHQYVHTILLNPDGWGGPEEQFALSALFEKSFQNPYERSLITWNAITLYITEGNDNLILMSKQQQQDTQGPNTNRRIVYQDPRHIKFIFPNIIDESRPDATDPNYNLSLWRGDPNLKHYDALVWITSLKNSEYFDLILKDYLSSEHYPAPETVYVNRWLPNDLILAEKSFEALDRSDMCVTPGQPFDLESAPADVKLESILASPPPPFDFSEWEQELVDSLGNIESMGSFVPPPTPSTNPIQNLDQNMITDMIYDAIYTKIQPLMSDNIPSSQTTSQLLRVLDNFSAGPGRDSILFNVYVILYTELEGSVPGVGMTIQDIPSVTRNKLETLYDIALGLLEANILKI